MLDEIYEDADQRMNKSIDALRQELSKLRTGRAHPSLLAQVMVPYYGSDTPLSQVANVSVLDARTLSVTPWEKQLSPAIEKAIINANLGLNPMSLGDTIKVPLPPLTEERRRDLARLVKQEAETARIAIRNIRRDANQTGKDLLKEKEITEDELRRAEDKIQKLTDKFVESVEQIVGEKEKDLMAV